MEVPRKGCEKMARGKTVVQRSWAVRGSLVGASGIVARQLPITPLKCFRLLSKSCLCFSSYFFIGKLPSFFLLGSPEARVTWPDPASLSPILIGHRESKSSVFNLEIEGFVLTFQQEKLCGGLDSRRKKIRKFPSTELVSIWKNLCHLENKLPVSIFYWEHISFL